MNVFKNFFNIIYFLELIANYYLYIHSSEWFKLNAKKIIIIYRGNVLLTFHLHLTGQYILTARQLKLHENKKCNYYLVERIL